VLTGSTHLFVKNLANVSNVEVINTYTYGRSASKKLNSVSQTQYAQERTQKVIVAETRLGPWNQGAEDYFKLQSNHTPKQLSEIFTGQSLSASVYATPLGGTHRIDTFSQSIAVSSSVYTGDFSDQQKDAILTRNTQLTDVNYRMFQDVF